MNPKSSARTVQISLSQLAKKLLILAILLSVMAVAATPSWASQPFRPGRGFVLRKEIKGAQLTASDTYTVRLYTKRDGKSPYDKSLLLAVVNEKSGETHAIQPAEVAGYEADIELAHFRDKQRTEIFLSMDSGGSGGYGYYYVVAFDGRAGHFLYRSDSDRLPYRVQGFFLDNFRCLVKVGGTHREAVIDLTSRKNTFIEAGVYDQSGKRQRQIELDVDPFSAMRPVDTNGDGIHELRGTAAYSAVFHANGICTATFTQSYVKGRWRLVDAEIAPR